MSDYLERASYTWSEDSIRLFNTPTTTTRQKFFYVQEVGHFKTKPPYFTERQNLDSYLILYTIAGSGFLKYDNSTYYLHPSQVFYIHCIPHHYYACEENDTWEFLWLHFNGKTALGYFEEFMKSGFTPVNFEDTFFIESTMRRILSLTQKKDLHSELISSNLIVNILTEILIKNSTDKLSLLPTPEYLQKLVKGLDNHFTESFSLDDIATKIGVSKFHLLREFHKYMGTTINEYIIVLRLNYAKELLRYSTETVNNITFLCGFNQVSHFISLFKDREGITPLQYRKEWQSV